MKQMVYARMAVHGVGSVKKDEGNGVVATSKYCAKAIEDDDDDDDDDEVDEEDEEEENRVGTEAQSNGDDVDVFEALFKPLSSSPTLRFVPSYCPYSPFPPSPSLAGIPQNVNKLFIGLGTPSHVTPTVGRPSIYFSIVMKNTSTRDSVTTHSFLSDAATYQDPFRI